MTVSLAYHVGLGRWTAILTGGIVDGYTDKNTPDLCNESGPRWNMEVMTAKRR